MPFPTSAVEALLAVVSGYALYHSAKSIPKLRKYEEKAQKAAEWSASAEKRLWDTRYTVAAGFITTLISLLAAAAYLLFIPEGFSLYRVAAAVLLAGGERIVSRCMHSFWANKAKVPLMDQYNEAISDCMDVVSTLDVLAVGWGLVAVLKLVGL